MLECRWSEEAIFGASFRSIEKNGLENQLLLYAGIRQVQLASSLQWLTCSSTPPRQRSIYVYFSGDRSGGAWAGYYMAKRRKRISSVNREALLRHRYDASICT